MTFDEAFDLVIEHEGGFTDNSKDRGNWTTGVTGKGELKGTKFGISAMTYPRLDIKNLTLQQAKNIYRVDFWLRSHCDELPKELAFDVFDLAVNSGVRTAIKLLQRSVGVNDDGWFGPQTRGAIRGLNGHVLHKKFNAQRLFFLADISTFNTFGRGWVRRVASNLMRG
jgi:lysozyme family protein